MNRGFIFINMQKKREMNFLIKIFLPLCIIKKITICVEYDSKDIKINDVQIFIWQKE